MLQPKRGFVAIDWAMAAASSAMTAAAIHRPGCRTGIALMSSGRGASTVVIA